MFGKTLPTQLQLCSRSMHFVSTVNNFPYSISGLVMLRGHHTVFATASPGVAMPSSISGAGRKTPDYCEAKIVGAVGKLGESKETENAT